MPKSMHLIHAGKKARGDLPKRKSPKPPLTLAEVRRRIKLPFTAEHFDPADLQKAIDQLPS